MNLKHFCVRCGTKEVPHPGDLGLCCTANLEAALLDLTDRDNPPMAPPPLLRALRRLGHWWAAA